MNEKQANDTFPVGTKVKYYSIAGDTEFLETEVRSEPWDLCGTVVVKVNGIAGGVSVNHLERIKREGE